MFFYLLEKVNMKKLILLLLLLTTICYGNSLELLISPSKIEEKIEAIAKQIDATYQGEELVIVAVMKGGICLTADLIRHITIPFTLEYMRASSYGMNGTEQGELLLKGMEDFDFANKNLLIVDDIFDSGRTMHAIITKIQAQNPKSVKSLVLLNKKIAKRTEYRPDYILFEIDDHFVIGYGMDYKEHYRGLPGIYFFKVQEM